MNAIRAAWKRICRGQFVTKLLTSLGIDVRRFWLLMDLFDAISERGEMMDQLGRNGIALNTALKVYVGLSAFLSLVFVLGKMPLAAYFVTFLFFTVILLVSILLSETGNSLVNPTEGMVLAHQPINGATYTAAKLSHLLRIVFYLAPGLNVIPALAGLMLPKARWFYPILHIAAAVIAGLATALLCCALFGWLMRFVPAQRLKAAGQMAATLPFLMMTGTGPIGKFFRRFPVTTWLPTQPAVRWGLTALAAVSVLGIIALGIRSLSADYLIRMSSMTRGGSGAGSRSRRSLIGGLVDRFFGGQAARAAFGFASRMMLRDWQFRRQLLPLLFPAILFLSSLLKSGRLGDPFGRAFTPLHLLPHIIGTLLFFICATLRYGGDFKGAWIFLLVSPRVIGGFARGVHALLWIECIVIPNLILLPLLGWLWGAPHALLFVAYSVAAASSYLALELKLVEEVPFSKQVDSSRAAVTMFLMAAGGAVMGIVVALQYFLIFHSVVAVGAVTTALGAGALVATRISVQTLAASMQFHLGLLSEENGTLYKEIAV